MATDVIRIIEEQEKYGAEKVRITLSWLEIDALLRYIGDLEGRVEKTILYVPGPSEDAYEKLCAAKNRAKERVDSLRALAEEGGSVE